MNRDEYVELLKSTALELGRRLVLQRLIVMFPFISLGPFSIIAGYIVGKILEIAIKETEFGAFVMYVDFRTNAQGREFEAAALKHQEAQKSGTPEEKANAEADLINKFRALARWTN